MPTFSYTALNKDDKTVSGTIEAINKEIAAETLHKQQLRPLVLKSSTDAKGLLSRLKGGKKVKLKDLVVFTRQLSTMVGAGVSLTRSLSTMQDQTESKYFKIVLSGIAKD